MQAEIVHNLRSFQDKVLRPGGKPPELALRDALEAVTSLKESSREVLRANINQLAFLGQSLDRNPQGLGYAYEKAVEVAELAPFLEMNQVAEVGQSLCELIFRMMAEGRSHPESFRVHIHALKLAFAAGQRGLEDEAATNLINQLSLVVGLIPDPDDAMRMAKAS